MTDWREVVEEGQIFYISSVGNIAKSIDGRFMAIVPATARFGPFDTLEQAQQSVEQNVESLKQHIETFSSTVSGFSAVLKR